MKFVAFEHRGVQGAGVLHAQAAVVHPLDLPAGADPSVLGVVEHWDALRPRLQAGRIDGPGLPLDEVALLAPIPRPRRNILAIGRNYVDHAQEFSESGYDATTGGSYQPDSVEVFSKETRTVIGTGDEIDPHTGVTSELDYEGELAVIIGRGGAGISREEAYGHVWGYTIVNDFTARDLQRSHKQWFLGKSLDTFCPMGPWAVDRSESGDGPFSLRTTVNREVRQDASTADLIFDVPTLTEVLSAGTTLEAGDLIATGTPKGVGIGFDPPRFLHPGDTVEISIDGLGTLRNTVGAPRGKEG